MREQFQALDEGDARIAAPRQFEGQYTAAAFRQQPLRQSVIGVAGQIRVADTANARGGLEKFGDYAGVVDMAGHSQRQGFKALQNLEGAHGRHAGAEIANAFLAGAGYEGLCAELGGKHQVVKAIVGF